MNPVEKFLKTYSSSKTQRLHQSNLRIYFDFLKAEPETYFTKERNYIDDITRWLEFQGSKAPLTRASRMTTVRLFFEDNNVMIPKQTLKQFKRKTKANKPLTLDLIPTNEELKTILSHADLKMRTLILVASSSGMRINEILHLEPQDCELNDSPAKIFVKGSIAKFGKSRVSFITDEARDSLREWLKGSNRENYLQAAVKKTNRKKNQLAYKNPENTFIFPCSYQTVSNSWYRLLKHSGLDSKDRSTNYYRLHIHTLRKYTKTRLLNANVSEPIVRKLLGQEDNLSSSYDRFTEQEVKEAYAQGMRELLVFETSPDLDGINESLQKKDLEIKSLQEEIKRLDWAVRQLGIEKLVELDGERKKK